METKTISLRVTRDFDRHLRIEAAKRDLTRSDFIRQTLARVLAETTTKQRSQVQKQEVRDES